jgi:hypothetical protein
MGSSTGIDPEDSDIWNFFAFPGADANASPHAVVVDLEGVVRESPSAAPYSTQPDASPDAGALMSTTFANLTTPSAPSMGPIFGRVTQFYADSPESTNQAPTTRRVVSTPYASYVTAVCSDRLC